MGAMSLRMGLGSHVLSVCSVHRRHVLNVGHREGPLAAKQLVAPRSYHLRCQLLTP